MQASAYNKLIYHKTTDRPCQYPFATKEITPAERSYLDRIAKMKGLQPGEAEALERGIRREMGLGAIRGRNR